MRKQASGAGASAPGTDSTFVPDDIWWMLARLVRNCAVADCDYKAHAGETLCYCHMRGFDPPLSFEEYVELNDDGLTAYAAEVRRLEAIRVDTGPKARTQKRPAAD